MLPGPRLEAGVTALGDELVMVGGFDTPAYQGLHITTEVDALDPLAGTWSRLPDAPVQWTHINLAAAGGALYLLGGTEGTEFIARGDAFALDAGASAWRTLAAMPSDQARGASAVIAAPPHIFIIGGAFTNTAVSTVLDYDISQDTWTQLPDLPTPRSHPAGMKMSDGTLVVVGGLATLDATQPIDDTIALPLGASAWETRSKSPIARGGCAYGVIGQSLVCVGGEAGAAALHASFSYDPYQDTWTQLPDMPTERAGTQGAAIGQQLFVPGGAQELQFVPTVTMSVFDALQN
jgi:N-acetylneuraminic acid mutarotase